ncbi:MAG: hypothetical protein IJU20_02550 [Clostridia bacterium]|nr:hypothetical protein [Clostridia bacterium]
MKKFLALLLALVMVASMVALSGCGSEPTKFDTPEEHFEYVAEKKVKEVVASPLAQYDEAKTTVDTASLKSTVSVELGPELQTLLGNAIGLEDTSALGAMEVALTTGSENNLTRVAADIKINQVSILTVEIIADMENGTIYAKTPVFSEDYIRFDLAEVMNSGIGSSIGEVGGMDLSSVTGMLAGVSDAKINLPDPDVLQRIILRYVGIVLSKFAGGQEENDVDYTVGSMTEKVKTVTATITQKSAQNAFLEVLRTLKTDEDIKTILNAAAQEGEDNADSLYQTFQSLLDRVITLVEREQTENVDQNGALVVKLYTNKKNELLGVDVSQTSVDEDGQESRSTIAVGSLDDGKNYAFKADVGENGESKFSVVSEGTLNKGKKTGNVTLTAGKSSLTAKVENFDTEAWNKEGVLSGRITIPFADITRFISAQGQSNSDMGSVTMALAMLASYNLVIDGKLDATETDLKIAVENENSVFAKINLKTAKEKAETIVKPGEATDLQTLLSEDTTVKFVNLINNLDANLEQAGFPKDFIVGLLAKNQEPTDPTGAPSYGE